MIDYTSQEDKMEAAMGIDHDKNLAHDEYRCCATDHGAKGLVSMAMVKANNEDVT